MGRIEKQQCNRFSQQATLLDLPLELLRRIFDELTLADLIALRSVSKAACRLASLSFKAVRLPLRSNSLIESVGRVESFASVFPNCTRLIVVGEPSNGNGTYWETLFSCVHRNLLQVRHLEIERCDAFFEMCLPSLSRVPRVESLRFVCMDNYCWPNASVLEMSLQVLPQLTSFAYIHPQKQSSVDDEHIAGIARGVRNLSELVIATDLSGLTNASLSCLSANIGLTRLLFSAWPHSDATCMSVDYSGLRQLSPLSNLVELGISMDGAAQDLTVLQANVPKDNLQPHLPELRRLHFEGNGHPQVLQWISCQTQLQNLHLWLPCNEFEKQFGTFGCVALSSLRTTQIHLNLEDVDVPFDKLRSIPNLVSLWCNQIRLSNIEVDLLAKLSGLRSLGLSGINWQGTSSLSFTALTSLRQLETLILELTDTIGEPEEGQKSVAQSSSPDAGYSESSTLASTHLVQQSLKKLQSLLQNSTNKLFSMGITLSTMAVSASNTVV